MGHKSSVHQLRLVVLSPLLAGFYTGFLNHQQWHPLKETGPQNKTHIPTPVFQWGVRVILDGWISQLVDFGWSSMTIGYSFVMKLKVCKASYSIIFLGSMYGIFTYTYIHLVDFCGRRKVNIPYIHTSYCACKKNPSNTQSFSNALPIRLSFPN